MVLTYWFSNIEYHLQHNKNHKIFILVLTLSYTVSPSPNNLGFRFADESIEFQCTYDRQIDIAEFQITFDSETGEPIKKHSSLGYKVDVNVGGIGEMSKIIITPDHDVNGVIAT